MFAAATLQSETAAKTAATSSSQEAGRHESKRSSSGVPEQATKNNRYASFVAPGQLINWHNTFSMFDRDGGGDIDHRTSHPKALTLTLTVTRAPTPNPDRT